MLDDPNLSLAVPAPVSEPKLKFGFSGSKMNVLYFTGGLGAEAGGGGLFRIELAGAKGLVILPEKR